jgi:hypothetical protein
VLYQALRQAFEPPQESGATPTAYGAGHVHCTYHSIGAASPYQVDVDLLYRVALPDATEAFNDLRQGYAYANAGNVSAVAGVGDEAFWAESAQTLFFRQRLVEGAVKAVGPFATPSAARSADEQLAQALIAHLS